MNNILIVAATSDLAKSYINSIKEESNSIDVIVRNPSKLDNVDLYNNIFVLDLSDINSLLKFTTSTKYSQIIFFQGIDIIKPFHLFKVDDILKIFSVNVLSIITLLNRLVSNKNISMEASILIISSISGITKGSPGHVLYSSSKSALVGLVKSLSLELSRRKIRINCISPGLIQTESLYGKNNQILSESEMLNYSKKYPLGIGELDSINGTINFLLNDTSKWITGQNFVVDGGNANI